MRSSQLPYQANAGMPQNNSTSPRLRKSVQLSRGDMFFCTIHIKIEKRGCANHRFRLEPSFNCPPRVIRLKWPEGTRVLLLMRPVSCLSAGASSNTNDGCCLSKAEHHGPQQRKQCHWRYLQDALCDGMTSRAWMFHHLSDYN